MKRSKKYTEAENLIEKGKMYSLDEAVDLLPKVSISKFDAAYEIHFLLNLTEKQKKESIKGSTKLPYQVGNAKKIAVITSPEHMGDADTADVTGYEDLIKKIEDGFSDFDVLIATPDVMPKLASLGKVLGPKGKMPNPKNGTITTDLKKAIQTYKEGKLDFKVDKQGGIHLIFGKKSMTKEQLLENLKVLIKAVLQESTKLNSIPFKSIFVTPTMGPSIKMDINNLIKELT
ncbi:MAG: 50S ribosomal protein L1 [Candidatus Dojkabacteria bacterium]|nr:50S ribosomal protein L1 [Candidatus Dojkabacteria bacterium]